MDDNFEQCQLVRKLSRGKFVTLSLVKSRGQPYIRRVFHKVTTPSDHWNRLQILQLRHIRLEQIVKIFIDVTELTIFTRYHSDVTLFDFVRGYFEPYLEERTILTWLCQISDGLQFLHERGYEHGNLSAKTILLKGREVRLLNWTQSSFLERGQKTDLECLGSVLLVLITLNSAVDGQYLREEVVNQLLESRSQHCSEFLLNITYDLLMNRMESVAYLRGLLVAPYDSLCISNQSLNLEDESQFQVDSSPIRRKERAQILHALAIEAARTQETGVHHPSIIVTFFNLFKLSIRKWKRSAYKWAKHPVKKCKKPKIERSVSCPANFHIYIQPNITG